MNPFIQSVQAVDSPVDSPAGGNNHALAVNIALKHPVKHPGMFLYVVVNTGQY